MADNIDDLFPPDTSVPRPTFIPASSIRLTSQNPELRLVFDDGQWAIDVLQWLINFISESSR